MPKISASETAPMAGQDISTIPAATANRPVMASHPLRPVHAPASSTEPIGTARRACRLEERSYAPIAVTCDAPTFSLTAKSCRERIAASPF